MKQKQFTKKQAKRKIETVLRKWKKQDLNGKQVSLAKVIGDYTYNSLNRHIKEVLFEGKPDSFRGKYGAIWYLKYPKKSSKKLAKKVMKTTYVTS